VRHTVRARADLQPLTQPGRPHLDVVGGGAPKAEIGGAQLHDTEWNLEPTAEFGGVDGSSLEGRLHIHYLEAPISFSVSVFDQRHWVISFGPNPSDPRGAALVFRDNEEGARRIADFIRHRWWEAPGVTMSLTEAYEKWKLHQETSAKTAGT